MMAAALIASEGGEYADDVRGQVPERHQRMGQFKTLCQKPFFPMTAPRPRLGGL
jgi:hypothetical protein